MKSIDLNSIVNRHDQFSFVKNWQKLLMLMLSLIPVGMQQIYACCLYKNKRLVIRLQLFNYHGWENTVWKWNDFLPGLIPPLIRGVNPAIIVDNWNSVPEKILKY